MASFYPRGVAVTGFPVQLLDDTGQPYSGSAPSVYVTKDGGAQAAATNTPTHNGNGEWLIDITATERDAKQTSLMFVADGMINKHTVIVSDDQVGPGGIETILAFGSDAAYANIWINDEYGNTVASGVATGTGTFTVYLPAGTYSVYGQKAGVNFANPIPITVS